MHVSTDTAFLLGSILGPGGALLAIASRYLPRPRKQPAAAPPAQSGAAVHVPCHDLRCGHLSTPHDRTPLGLVCRVCGTTTRTKDGVR